MAQDTLLSPHGTSTPFEFRLLASALELLPVPKAIVDAAGLIQFVNAPGARLFGYSPPELQGKPVEMLIPERFRGGHPRNRGSFVANPASRPMGAGRDLFALRRDGTEIPVEIGLNPIDTDCGPMVIAVIVDITARKRQERRFAQAVESSPNAMVMIDREGHITMVNAQTEALFGYDRSEILGQPIELLVPERFRRGHPRFREGFFAAPGARPMGAGRDLYARRKDGSEVPVEIGLNPIETEEGPMVLSAIVDITDRKQREERIRAALQEKEILLGEIHHRVKNNLQIIHSLLDLQAMRIEDPKIRDMLHDSESRVRSMSLIHQTLYQSHDFARVDFGHFLESLAPVIQQSFAAGREGVEILVDGGGVSLPIGMAIPCGLVVNELVTNALKHGFAGRDRGRVSVSLSRQADGFACLAVENDGAALPAEATASSTLGLQLVHLLADQLRGTIEIRRESPVRFSIAFPMEVA